MAYIVPEYKRRSQYLDIIVIYSLHGALVFNADHQASYTRNFLAYRFCVVTEMTIFRKMHKFDFRFGILQATISFLI